MIGYISAFFIKHLAIIHKGAIASKIKSSIVLGASLSPFAFIAERITEWYITNQLTIYIICGAILADWLVGVGKHLFKKTFSWKLMVIGLLIKLSMVVVGSFLGEALPHFTGENNLLSNSLLTILRLSTFMYPAGSCWVNMAVITNGKYPSIGWLKRINEFSKNLTIKDLTDGKQSTTN
jgi:hypothetical protein